MITHQTRVLFLTVGTGNKEDQKGTIITPFLKTMRDGHFTHYVFLSSKKTLENAQALKAECEKQSEFTGKTIEIESLPNENDEDDADKCFDYFNQIIHNKMEKLSCSVHQITIDMTRGTKIMSAALYSAGLRHGIVNYRYITGERDNKGQVIKNTEKIYPFPASKALFLMKVDQAKIFLSGYNFKAVETMFQEEDYSNEFQDAEKYIYHCAKFYGAWHRLDYKAAYAEMNEAVFKNSPEKQLKELGLECLVLTEDVKNWITELKEDWPSVTENEKTNPDKYKEMCYRKAPQAFRIAVDLLENGRRQLKIGNYEDVKVRIYRVIELVGQIYLFSQGYDTAYIKGNDQNIQEYCGKTSSPPMPKQEKNNGEKYFELPREQAASFIKYQFNREFGKKLLQKAASSGSERIIAATARNNSVLIHGFVIQDQEVKEAWFNELENLLKEVVPNGCNFENYLKIAKQITHLSNLTKHYQKKEEK